MMKKLGTVLVLLATWPFLTAGGGNNPPQTGFVIVNPAISATILMDPHMAKGDLGLDSTPLTADVTPPTSKQAVLFLRQGTLTAQATFKVLPSFALYHGCDLNFTTTRFLYSTANPAKLPNWVPPFTLESLFLPFGITVSPTMVPVITQINSQQCLFDPANPSPTVGQGYDPISPNGPGWLFMNVTIQFQVPGK